jgi:hypothetical protein
MTKNYAKAFDQVLEFFETIADEIEYFRLEQKTFADSRLVQSVSETLYIAILKFWVEAVKYHSKHKSKYFVHLLRSICIDGYLQICSVESRASHCRPFTKKRSKGSKRRSRSRTSDYHMSQVHSTTQKASSVTDLGSRTGLKPLITKAISKKLSIIVTKGRANGLRRRRLTSSGRPRTPSRFFSFTGFPGPGRRF